MDNNNNNNIVIEFKREGLVHLRLHLQMPSLLHALRNN
jgi:hypothetical protein